jgi:transposase
VKPSMKSTPPFRSISFGIGNVMVIDKVNASLNLFNELFDGLHKKAHLKQTAKLLTYNRLGDCVSVNRLDSIYPEELFQFTGFKKVPNKKAVYRDLQRIGDKSEIILNRYQILLKREKLIANKQFIDFSSSYFEGNNAALAALGYSRDHEPGKKQITFGISTGINSIPTALTIQKGNVQDKPHMRSMIRVVDKVFPDGTLCIFDTGGNTRENKTMIRERELHYLTLRPKKKAMYSKYIAKFKQQKKEKISFSNQEYSCVKMIEEKEVKYIFFCKKLKKDQLAKCKRKFEKQKEKNEPLLKKISKGKPIGKFISRLGEVIAKGSIQTTLGEEKTNPFITGLEGYFILESSVNTEPEKVLRLYKDKDKAEKLIRDMKEGTELRPIRHWSTNALLGYLLIVFLTNCVIQLTLFFSEVTVAKNGKLLTKYLSNVTLTVVYPPGSIKFSLISNISPEIRTILGDFIDKYRDNSVESRLK